MFFFDSQNPQIFVSWVTGDEHTAVLIQKHIVSAQMYFLDTVDTLHNIYKSFWAPKPLTHTVWMVILGVL